MLKLRKVEIVGFKSFCDRTVVTFSGSGTTCIVGPNGCGKSNVVDAISWVLGEQSHKSLRAERMADCIFNGTTKRPPLGMAEVTITMEDAELAEAARFVLEGAEADTATETEEAPVEEIKATSTHDSNTQILSLDPAPAPEAQQEVEGTQEAAAQADEVSTAAPEFLKGKRRKKGTDKPVLAV
ncbi:MAG: AAA family ATPase, partial [Candidatus Acidiferrum sp.]